MLITAAGVIIRMPVDRISQMGRNTRCSSNSIRGRPRGSDGSKSTKDEEEETSEEVSSEE